MVKGRNSRVVHLRLRDDEVEELGRRAGELSVGLYIQQQVRKSLSRSVEKTVATIKEPPLYNPAIHKAGDTVKVWRGKRLEVVKVPELDADGQVM